MENAGVIPAPHQMRGRRDGVGKGLFLKLTALGPTRNPGTGRNRPSAAPSTVAGWGPYTLTGS